MLGRAAEADKGVLMEDGIERNLGEQPIMGIMAEHALKGHDVVARSPEPITHKMVARACKGRRLTLNARNKVRNALNAAVGKEYAMRELFNY
jgi:hypothetical protein